MTEHKVSRSQVSHLYQFGGTLKTDRTGTGDVTSVCTKIIKVWNFEFLFSGADTMPSLATNSNNSVKAQLWFGNQ
jgi:hypothetical protein